ncbi:hypothetical protein NHQ30_001312 [Ciborinia camelliae]|nr:hypothetical protein NHQ30_001312 [Ciborinia camelliae]
MSANAILLEGWREQNSAPATCLPLTFFELLKECYPTHHITQTHPEGCDLLGYADAGYAKAVHDDQDANWSMRMYHTASARLKDEPKTLKDLVNFGKWIYTWQEKEYIVYRVNYTNGLQRGFLTLQFILVDGYVCAKDNPEVDALILAVGAWSTELHDEIYVFDNQRWVKDPDLYDSVNGFSWDEVILNPTMKKNLIADVQGFFDNQALYKQLAVPWKRGIILHGVPGNGKTISIKALINTLSQRSTPIPSLYVKSFSGDNGQQWAINNIFQQARNMAPCLLIIEDLDSLVTDKTRSYFLNEVDGLESNDGILMIGSTNHLARLDPAISKRPSRFDRKYHFKMPNEEEREAYVHFWREKLADSEMVDFGGDLCTLVAKLTEGFSFAYLKELFVITLLGIARGATGAGDGVDDASESEGGASNLSDDGVVVEKEATDDFGECQPATGSEETAELAKHPKAPKTLPKLDVPEHLKDNILLKALIIQAKMLMEDMDNTDELVVAEKVPGPNGLKRSSSSFSNDAANGRDS